MRVMATLFYDLRAAVSSSSHQEELPHYESQREGKFICAGQFVPVKKTNYLGEAAPLT